MASIERFQIFHRNGKRAVKTLLILEFRQSADEMARQNAVAAIKKLPVETRQRGNEESVRAEKQKMSFPKPHGCDSHASTHATYR